MDIKVQSSAEDVKVYGWTLEIRWRNPDGQMGGWFTYWNNRIYNTQSSGIEAAIKVYPSYKKDYEWRVLPIYKMTEPEFRDYKIDQVILDSTKSVASKILIHSR
jgi:hypothetical protein